MTQKIPMTAGGAEKLREELQYLKSVARPKVISAIAEARGHGDLRENAEYHAAKEQQGFIEGRIREIEHKLSHSQIIDLEGLVNNGKVVFGATITLINMDTDQEVIYQIVGEDEADLKVGKISVSSPIARALIGKHKGDSVDVQAPNGVISYEIMEVSYIPLSV
jgi:transcription elongation factor GreA